MCFLRQSYAILLILLAEVILLLEIGRNLENFEAKKNETVQLALCGSLGCVVLQRPLSMRMVYSWCSVWLILPWEVTIEGVWYWYVASLHFCCARCSRRRGPSQQTAIPRSSSVGPSFSSRCLETSSKYQLVLNAEAWYLLGTSMESELHRARSSAYLSIRHAMPRPQLAKALVFDGSAFSSWIFTSHSIFTHVAKSVIKACAFHNPWVQCRV